MDPVAIDQVQLNFNPTGLMIINGAIGLMMLGVALELKFEDFCVPSSMLMFSSVIDLHMIYLFVIIMCEVD